MSLSKSKRKSARCPVFHNRGRNIRMASPLRDAGIDFHRYKQEYVEHLVDTGQRADPDWALSWLGASGVCEDARRMIEWDVQRFEIDPDSVLGTEVFLVIGQDGEPLPGVPFPGYGKDPDAPGALAHGTMDLVCARDATLTLVIDDYKTGWSPYVDTEEADHYAALAFSHYPEEDTIVFNWVQVRLGKIETRFYTRDQFPALLRGIRNAEARVAAIEADPDPEPNPFSGNCAFCHVTCPVRGAVPMLPVQNEADLKAAMGYIEATETQLKTVKDAARAYLVEAGPVEVAPDKRAQITVSERMEYPLADTLRALDVDVPDETGEWGIPLNSLRVASTELNRMAGAKKRAGLREALEPAGKKKLWREMEVVTVPSVGSD